MKRLKLLMKKYTPKKLFVGFLLIFLLAISFYIGIKYKQGSLPIQKSPASQLNNVITLSPSPSVAVNPTSTSTVVPQVQNYPVPKSWTRTNILNGLTLCFPPKWEADQWGNVYFNRDSAYRPNVTYIQEIPYQGGSRRESFYAFWVKEYPNVGQTVSVNEVSINKGTILKFSGPEGEKIVWLANGKLWQAGISNWSMVNDSKTTFLKDFYTMIGCSF